MIANTVHISTISRYHAADHRSGIGFGPRNDLLNSEKDEAESFVPDLVTSLIALLLPFVFPPDPKRRTTADLALLEVAGRYAENKPLTRGLECIGRFWDEDKNDCVDLQPILIVAFLPMYIIAGRVLYFTNR